MKPIFICLFLSSSILLAESLPIDTTLSKQEQEEIGIDKMTPEQKQAFERWSGNWTQKVIQQAPNYHGSASLNEWIKKWPLADQPNTTATPKQIAEQQKSLNKVIDKIRDDGRIVELKDGSVWRISDIDRKKTVTWNRGDRVEWAKSDATYPAYYITNLMENNINPTVRQIAGATMITPPSPTGIKPPEPPDYYRGSVKISIIQTKGWEITLDDNTLWKIAPRDWATVLRWQRSDRVRVEKNNDMLYPYKLLNLDSGEQALANSKK